MLRINHFIVIAFIASIFVSCGEKEMDTSMLWGETDYYTDFLFKDYEPIKMTKTICFETNEDANGRVGNVKFGLYKKTEEESYIPVKDEIRLYKNDVLCENNILLITPQDKEIQLGIEFTPEAKEGIHKWFLKVLDNGGFDRINEFATEEDSLPLLLELKAEKNDIVNPLKLGLNISLLVLIGLILIWFFIIKPIIYPTFKIGNIQFTDGIYFSTKRIYGARKLVITNSSKKQGPINRMFTGKIVYEKNELWPDEWEIQPKGKGGRFVGNRKYTINPFTTSLNKQMEYEIEHSSLNVKVKITLS
ncbi:MAG: hypothetical protein E7095_03955 [Bacteroides sp.]|nr:hypothetical protein [Bacteroides sp.]